MTTRIILMVSLECNPISENSIFNHLLLQQIRLLRITLIELSLLFFLTTWDATFGFVVLYELLVHQRMHWNPQSASAFHQKKQSCPCISVRNATHHVNLRCEPLWQPLIFTFPLSAYWVIFATWPTYLQLGRNAVSVSQHLAQNQTFRTSCNTFMT